MTNMTLSVPKDLRDRMARHPEIKWTEVIRAKLNEYLDALEEISEVPSSSLRIRLNMGSGDITEKDIVLAKKSVSMRDDA